MNGYQHRYPNPVDNRLSRFVKFLLGRFTFVSRRKYMRIEDQSRRLDARRWTLEDQNIMLMKDYREIMRSIPSVIESVEARFETPDAMHRYNCAGVQTMRVNFRTLTINTALSPTISIKDLEGYTVHVIKDQARQIADEHAKDLAPHIAEAAFKGSFANT